MCTENPFANKEYEELFLEKLMLLGFKLTGLKSFDVLPNNKDACLLLTKKSSIRSKIMGWASDHNAVVVYNPDELNYEQCAKLFAFIMDDEIKESFPYQDLLEGRFISTRLDIEFIEDFLDSLLRYNNR